VDEKKAAIVKILETAILQEIKSKRFYLKIAEQVSDKNAKNRLKRMAESEQEHEDILKSWYEETCGKPYRPPEKISSEHKADLKVPDENATLIDVVKLITRAENKAYQYYKYAATMARKPEEKEIFENLAGLEQMHADQSLTELHMLANEEIHYSDEDIPWEI